MKCRKDPHCRVVSSYSSTMYSHFALDALTCTLLLCTAPMPSDAGYSWGNPQKHTHTNSCPLECFVFDNLAKFNLLFL